MRREYIFCSVIESPHIARRSLCRKSGPCGLGALSGLNWSKWMSFGCWANVGVRVRVQATNPRSRIVFERIVLMGGILWLSQPWVKTRVQEAQGAGARGVISALRIQYNLRWTERGRATNRNGRAQMADGKSMGFSSGWIRLRAAGESVGIGARGRCGAGRLLSEQKKRPGAARNRSAPSRAARQ